MARENTDVLISGAGIAGLTAAAAFGAAGFGVICIDPSPPVTDQGASGADQRSTAFLQPAVPVLRAAGLWDRLAPFAAPLQCMRLIDAGRGAASAPHDFNAAEVSDQPFGWNLPNWLLRREMMAALDDLPNVSFRAGLGSRALTSRDDQAIVTLSDGSRIGARLAIAADGRASPLREAAGIGVTTRRYGQKALAFTVAHSAPHLGISTEIHRSGGPFTLVPLQGGEAGPASSVVWMEQGAEALRLAALPVPEFEAAMTDRSGGVLGALRLTSARALWPIVSQVADRMAGPRLALLAEAAHVVPPIGAQGLNLSLADLGALLDLARAAPQDLGSEAMLQAYHRARHPDVRARVIGIDALNRASMAGAPVLQDLRRAALALLHASPPARKALMRAGIGQR